LQLRGMEKVIGRQGLYGSTAPFCYRIGDTSG
jgi:hypothetical protein